MRTTLPSRDGKLSSKAGYHLEAFLGGTYDMLIGFVCVVVRYSALLCGWRYRLGLIVEH